MDSGATGRNGDVLFDGGLHPPPAADGGGAAHGQGGGGEQRGPVQRGAPEEDREQRVAVRGVRDGGAAALAAQGRGALPGQRLGLDGMGWDGMGDGGC